MKSNNSYVKFALVFALVFVSFNAGAQSEKVKDNTSYFHFVPYELFVERDNISPDFYTITPGNVGNHSYAFAKVSVNTKNKTISLALYNNNKVLVSSEEYSYTDKLTNKKAKFTGDHGDFVKSWSEIDMKKLE